jgi:hypothetical protein
MPSPFQSASARRRFYRRSICMVLLGAFTITAIGIPLPAGTKESEPGKSNELFPCATSSCGCRTANQCWRSCCCHSLAERIAWARRHGVVPPAFALAQAKATGIDVTCCATSTAKQKPSCCETRLAASQSKSTRSCCSKHNDSTTSESHDMRVVGWQSLKCKGHTMNWLAAVPTLIVVHQQQRHDLPFSNWLAPIASDHPAGTADRPALPPPEAA